MASHNAVEVHWLFVCFSHEAALSDGKVKLTEGTHRVNYEGHGHM